MRRARYDLKQVVCPKSHCLGYSSNIARPGYWVAFGGFNGYTNLGRVLGRVAETDRDGEDCKGYLAVVRLIMEGTHAHVVWVKPDEVTACYEKSPKNLLAWLTGDEWVKNKGDIARIIAMGEHGTLDESYIATRDDPDKAYNARPDYVNQFILKE